MSFASIRIPLQSPVPHGDEEIKELVIGREMTAGDLRGISVKDLKHDDICVVASRLTGIPTPIINKLKMSDYLEVAKVVSDFFDDSPPTGKKE